MIREEYIWDGFTEMIDALQECLSEKYHGNAFNWADENLDNAWTTAVNRFEAAIDLTRVTQDRQLFKLELEFYKHKTLDLFSRFKKLNTKADAESYLETLKKQNSQLAQ